MLLAAQVLTVNAAALHRHRETLAAAALGAL